MAKVRKVARRPTRKIGPRKPKLEHDPSPKPADDPFSDPVVEQITGDILQHHGAANRNSVTVRAEIGRLLLDAREHLPHGSFGAYLSARIPYTPKTAERAINLHRFKLKQPALFDKLAPVGLSKAYVLIDLPANTSKALVAKAHRTSSGHDKTLMAMTFSEFIEIVTGGPAEPNPGNPLIKSFRLAGRRLMRALDALVDQRDQIDPDELADLYEELRLTMSRFADTFELERE